MGMSKADKFVTICLMIAIIHLYIISFFVDNGFILFFFGFFVLILLWCLAITIIEIHNIINGK